MKQEELEKINEVFRPKDRCPKCGKKKHTERRNYDMMWGEAELWCGKCNVFIRDMDFG